jgi:hypothetical protein
MDTTLIAIILVGGAMVLVFWAAQSLQNKADKRSGKISDQPQSKGKALMPLVYAAFMFGVLFFLVRVGATGGLDALGIVVPLLSIVLGTIIGAVANSTK